MLDTLDSLIPVSDPRADAPQPSTTTAAPSTAPAPSAPAATPAQHAEPATGSPTRPAAGPPARETAKSLRARPHATRLRFIQDNPKRQGTPSHARYEAYKSAQTFGDFLRRGEIKDLLWDLRHHFVEFVDEPAPEVVALLALQSYEESLLPGLRADAPAFRPASAAATNISAVQDIKTGLVDDVARDYIMALLHVDSQPPPVASVSDIEDDFARAEGRTVDTEPTIEHIMDELLREYLTDQGSPGSVDEAEQATLAFFDVVAALDVASGDPTSFKDIMNDTERRDAWLASMKAELGKLIDEFKTFRVTTRSEMLRARTDDKDTRCLFCKWVWVDKISRLRSRLVSCENAKHHWVPGTWSPTVGSETVKYVIALATQRALRLTSLDIGNAYLYGRRRGRADGRPPAPVYLHFPKGMRECGFQTHTEDGEELMFAVEGNHYGLRDAGAVFYDEMKSFLTDLSFHQSAHDPCLWFKSLDDDGSAPKPSTRDAGSALDPAAALKSLNIDKGSDNWCIILLYVDDLLALFSGSTREYFMSRMAQRFHQSPDSDIESRVTTYCGYEITQSEDNRTANIRTPKVYAKLMRVCDHLGLQHLYDAPATTPFPACAIPDMAKPASDDNPIIPDSEFPLRSFLGSCAWAVLANRPAEVFYLAMLLQHMHRPTAAVVRCVKHFTSYLLGTRDDPLVYVASEDFAHMFYADSSHGNVDFKGVIGRLSMVGRNPFAWRCRLPKVVTLSSRDAELMASIHAARSIISFGIMLRELGLHPGGPLPLCTDSKATELSATSDLVHPESRWNGIRIRWLQQQVAHGLVKIIWCSGADMLADVMTKVLPVVAFYAIRRILMNLADRTR